jgi:hypothetical protein
MTEPNKHQTAADLTDATFREADFPDHLPPVEGQIISLILDRALAQEDIQIAVDWDDLGDEGLAFTRDRSAIEREIAATSVTFLRFFRQNVRNEDIPQGRIGWVMLVHGNIEDVVSDYSDNEWTRALMGPVDELANKVSEESLG